MLCFLMVSQKKPMALHLAQNASRFFKLHNVNAVFSSPSFRTTSHCRLLGCQDGEDGPKIAKAEKKIEYLGELKQSLITRAVTRGLNPNAPLKDSGVKWIGDIPRDWEIPRLNFVTSKSAVAVLPKVVVKCMWTKELYF